MAGGAWATVLDRVDPADKRTDLGRAEWDQWLRTCAGPYFRSGFAPHHAELWRWVDAIAPGVRPQPFVAVWNRGGAKSTSAEAAVARLGARRARRYALYVCDTQDRANDHVQNIAALLESRAMERHHPEMARRMVGKYGHSKGWQRTRLRTSSGFTVDAIGLDTASRGVKLEDARPDLLVIDDVDQDTDSAETTQHKIDALTRKLIPAGSRDVAVLAVQNLVHPDGVFAQMVDGRADFLRSRIMSGPVKAVENLEVAEVGDRWVILGGSATWVGLPLSVCQAIIDDVGITAFLAEYQHEVEPPPGGLFDKVTFHHCEWSEIPWGLVIRSTVWVDPAVSDTKSSDSYGIQADAITIEGVLYRLWSWEQRTSPLDALKRAIRTAWLIQAGTVGVETDQGGDTWAVVYDRACEVMEAEWRTQRHEDPPPRPAFIYEKAGAGHGPKIARAAKMLVDYETPGKRIVHVRGTHLVLERALRRFPKTKPLDLADASYWSWRQLRESSLIPPGATNPTDHPGLTGDLLHRAW